MIYISNSAKKRNKELLKNKNEYTKFKEKIKIKNKQRF